MSRRGSSNSHSRKPFANGFDSIFREVICKVKAIFNNRIGQKYPVILIGSNSYECRFGEFENLRAAWLVVFQYVNTGSISVH